MTDGIDWSKLTSNMIEKYGGQAPRYTSYPTAMEWTHDFAVAEYRAALAEAASIEDEPLSIYVHIPFCKKRCAFCGCASEVCTATERYDVYLDAVGKETQAVASSLKSRLRVSSLHLGGGTPTVLDGKRLKKLVGVLQNSFDFSSCSELAIEAAPSVTSDEQLEALAKLGFNRISFGVQDFTQEVQAAVDRVQDLEHTIFLIEKARKLGFAINLDLMYGLPKQNPKTWSETLEQTIDLHPNRLAVFGYAHVPWMRPNQQAIQESDLPDAILRLELFKAAHDRLLNAGYVYIGMDHFALPQDTLAEAFADGCLSRNFQGYTVKHSSSLIGLGATAISDLGSAFAQNQAVTDNYEACIENERLGTYRGKRLTVEDHIRRHVITELMCNLTLTVSSVEELFGIVFSEYFRNEIKMLQQLEADGLVNLTKDKIQITSQGRLFVRHVGLVFDLYSKQKKEGKSFSRTV